MLCARFTEPPLIGDHTKTMVYLLGRDYSRNRIRPLRNVPVIGEEPNDWAFSLMRPNT